MDFADFFLSKLPLVIPRRLKWLFQQKNRNIFLIRKNMIFENCFRILNWGWVRWITTNVLY